MTDVFGKVRAILGEQFGMDAEDVREDTGFLSDLDADSLDVVELAMRIEEAFGLPQISEEAIQGIETVGDLVDYVTNALG